MISVSITTIVEPYWNVKLHTEYRVFVDFDTNEVLGSNNMLTCNLYKIIVEPYWNVKEEKRKRAEENWISTLPEVKS